MNKEEAVELCKKIRRGEKIELAEALALINFIPALLDRCEDAESKLREIKRVLD